ncbi:glycosidase [Dokdonia sinensis]|uniref:Glycosidase n=1 Tax=Dokdonia sinensis TaxID=2479847 RepID=A0A3M0GEB2_9FLAO|nr:glycosidase [Dokdonia sinensis]RMB60992.1 glycosidase [Dokdonia sinensis]
MSQKSTKIPNGVMLNAYPDSIGTKLSDTVALLKRPEFKDVFSLFYALPTFFNSDLDRGFSIIDYDLNKDLVTPEDLETLEELNVMLKFDIVLNHLSVGSPQFQDMLTHGDDSKYKDFFINWNQFWEGNGTKNEQGIIVPKKEYLDKLFMRKPGLPILNVLFPDGSERPYWNTFYQQVTFHPIQQKDLEGIDISEDDRAHTVSLVNDAIGAGEELSSIRFRESVRPHKKHILTVVNQKRTYLGQMDVNANSELVWDFYDETLKKVSAFGCKILRLDAFAYLHKEVGKTNFFNTPGTWDHLERIRKIAEKYELVLLPEIHSEYGLGLHDEVASKGYQIYDFFFPGLVIHTLETADATALVKWANEIVTKVYKTVNMLGCHDGIPVLDLKGVEKNGEYHKGLLQDAEIENIINIILDRGGRVKNIYDPEGNKISYYQVNATFYSALGENDDKLLLARALQLFMPGIPQIWYLDLFAGKNDYVAADAAGTGGHKEINRTTLSQEDIEAGLQKEVVLRQLEMLRLRNTHPAFNGKLSVTNINKDYLEISWKNGDEIALLKADLSDMTFEITVS